MTTLLHHADGAALIAAERQRQIEAEGWTSDHDDAHRQEQIAHAAACYAIPPRMRGWLGPMVMNTLWPWDSRWWKPTAKKGKGFAHDHEGDRVSELVKAGALIAAEIDRLQRKAQTEADRAA